MSTTSTPETQADAIREEYARAVRFATEHALAGDYEADDLSTAADYARGRYRLAVAEAHKRAAAYRWTELDGDSPHPQYVRTGADNAETHERIARHNAQQAAAFLQRAGMYDAAEAERVEAAYGGPVEPDRLDPGTLG